MHTRPASIEDAEQMGRVLQEIAQHTGRSRPHDVSFIVDRYIADRTSLRCTVAVDAAGTIMGFNR